MNTIFSNFRVTLFAGFVALGVASAPTLAVEDVLLTPSMQTLKANQRLLLDIDQAGDRLISVGERGHILFSDDLGGSWQQASVPVSVLLTAVSFADERNGWAVGHSGVILHSSDGGETWVKQFDGNDANKMIITQSENLVSKLSEELDTAPEDMVEDIAYQLEDAEFAVEDAQADAEIGASKPMLDVLFLTKEEGFVVGAYGFIFKTEDGGATWKNYGARMDNPDRFHLNSITRIKDGTLFIAGEAGVIFRSKNNGESWESLESPYSGSFFGLSGTADPQVILVFGLRGNLYRSNDAGDTWEEIESTTESTLIAASYNDQGDVIIVGNSGSTLFSSDGGLTFMETIRSNRLGVASVIFVNNDQLVIVGEDGVHQANSSGINLK